MTESPQTWFVCSIQSKLKTNPQKANLTDIRNHQHM